jgi:hypothetical protein
MHYRECNAWYTYTSALTALIESPNVCVLSEIAAGTACRLSLARDKPVKASQLVKVDADGRSSDEARLRGPNRWSFSRAMSPMSKVMPTFEVIAKYHDLWHAERSFRMSMTDLRARPMSHRAREAIEVT